MPNGHRKLNLQLNWLLKLTSKCHGSLGNTTILSSELFLKDMGDTLTPNTCTFKQFLGLLLTLVGCRRAVLGLYATGIADYVTENILPDSRCKTVGMEPRNGKLSQAWKKQRGLHIYWKISAQQRLCKIRAPHYRRTQLGQVMSSPTWHFIAEHTGNRSHD